MEGVEVVQRAGNTLSLVVSCAACAVSTCATISSAA
jgi:hypothetical protein